MVVFDCYEEAPYYPDSSYKPPVSRYHYVGVTHALIYSKIQKLINYEHPISLSLIQESKCNTAFMFPENSTVKRGFLKYVAYLACHSIDSIMFLGKDNHNCAVPAVFISGELNAEYIPITDPYLDCSNQLTRVLKQKRSYSSFPYSHICNELNLYYLACRKKGLDSGAKRALIYEIGFEVAMRNGYKHNAGLSAKNSRVFGKTRDIFVCKDEIYYLSLDYESGGFELFNSTRIHLGQFSFSGCQTQPADPLNHKIVL